VLGAGGGSGRACGVLLPVRRVECGVLLPVRRVDTMSLVAEHFGAVHVDERWEGVGYGEVVGGVEGDGVVWAAA